MAGRYKVLCFHKAGGMSLTYRADEGGKALLLKEVDATDSRSVISLTQERSTLERLDHPGIVKTHDLFEEDGHYYLVMDFVSGTDLASVTMARQETEYFDERTLVDWANQLCDIFDYLHCQKPPVIYRDLKPRNIIRRPDGKLVLIDFGVARVFKDNKARDTAPMGSALTASPEHYGMTQTDERSDIYTLGATLHHMAVNGQGRPEEPFRFMPVRDFNPDLSERFESVVSKAVEIKPDARFQNISDFRMALSGKSQAQPTSLLERPAAPPPKPQNLGAYAGWAVAAILGVLVLVLATRGPSQPESVEPTPRVSQLAQHSASPSPSPSPLPPSPTSPSPEPVEVVAQTTPVIIPVQTPEPQPPRPSRPEPPPKPSPPPARPSYPTAKPSYPTAKPTVTTQAPPPIADSQSASASFKVTPPAGYRKQGPGHRYMASNPNRTLEALQKPWGSGARDRAKLRGKKNFQYKELNINGRKVHAVTYDSRRRSHAQLRVRSKRERATYVFELETPLGQSRRFQKELQSFALSFKR